MPLFEIIEETAKPTSIPKHGVFSGSSCYWPGSAVVLLETYLDEGLVVVNTVDLVPEASFLQYYIDCIGLDWTLGLEAPPGASSEDMRVLEFLASEGIAPGQQFWVGMEVWSSKYWTDCGYEHDGGVDWEVLSAVPLKRTHLEAWEEVLAHREEKGNT